MIHSYRRTSSADSSEEGEGEEGSSSSIIVNGQKSTSCARYHPRGPCETRRQRYGDHPIEAALPSPSSRKRATQTSTGAHRNRADPSSSAAFSTNDAELYSRVSPRGALGAQAAASPNFTRPPGHSAPALIAPTRSSSPSEQPQALLETVLMVATRVAPNETQPRPLGVFVRTGRGGANGVTRAVLIRLTDPADPFFLYELELLEDDYGSFKQQLELLVDFQGFPRFLVSMLRDVADSASPYELSFVLNGTNASDANRGTLRVLERTDFKTVEHLSLVLLRQGDAGLKRYLAERFQHYERSFREAEAARAATTADLEEKVQLLQRANEEVKERLRRADEEMRFMSSDKEKEQLAALNRMREQHSSEIKTMRDAYERKIEALSNAVEEKSRKLRDSTREKDAVAAELRSHLSELEARVTSLQSHARNAEDTASIRTKELATVRELNEELVNFKTEATKAMTENELNYVTLTERLRGTSLALQNREEKVAALQAHYEKQDDYIRIVAEQNRQQSDRLHAAEKNLEKAHHIIANQLQAIKSAKERYHIAMDQLRSQEALLQEREASSRRQYDELSTATERVQELLRKNNELREQLETINDAREKLMQELKLSQQALLRLQQTTSINGRHWGFLSNPYNGRDGSSAGVAATSAVPMNAGSLDLMREFSANAHLTGLTGHPAAAPKNVGYSVSSAGLRHGGAYAPGSASLSSMSPAAVPSNASQQALFTAKTPSASLPQSSQERAGSADTAGLTEPHGRTSSSSLSKPETASHGVSLAAQPPPTSSSLDKPSPRTARSSFHNLAVKSFFNGDNAGRDAPVITTGPAQESAYF